MILSFSPYIFYTCLFLLHFYYFIQPVCKIFLKFVFSYKICYGEGREIPFSRRIQMIKERKSIMEGCFSAQKKDGSLYYRASVTYRAKHISLGSFSVQENAGNAYGGMLSFF